MKIRYMLAALLVLTSPLCVRSADEDAPASVPGEKFVGGNWTQSIAVVNERDSIEPVSRSRLEKKWRVPGGMENLAGWRVEKYKYIPEKPATWIGNISVKNNLGYYQNNRGLLRRYADGTRFDEVLINQDSGKVFEHRVAVKKEGKWSRYVESSDAEARPGGYTGLKQTCASCHSEAGSGEYGVGLVSGADTVISDPLPWELVGRRDPAEPLKYYWEKYDNRPDQIALMLDGSQVGSYSFTKREFWWLLDREKKLWADKSSVAPLPLPAK
jgi:hypothetical protein